MRLLKGAPGMIGLAMCLAIMLSLVILSSSTVLTLRSLKRHALYQQKVLQAQFIAESGLSDALLQLQANESWRTGFSQKAMKGGYYTVTLSSDKRPWITATGYSASLALLGRAFRTVKVRADPTPVPQFVYGLSSEQDITFQGNARIDSYNSEVDPSPSSFGSSAKVWSNDQVTFARVFYSVYGTCNYRNTPAPAANTVSGTVTLSTYTINLASVTTSSFATDNDNLTGITPSSYYNTTNRNLTVPVGQSATIKSGSYYLNKVDINGTLTLDITDGPVALYMTSDLDVTGAIVNPTEYPANLLITLTDSHDHVLINATAPLHAMILDKLGNFTLSSTFYGAVIAKNFTMTDTGRFHQDLALQRNRIWATRLMGGTWTSLSTRQ